jgi:hypothetical protein
LATESIPSCAYGFELAFDIVDMLSGEPDDEFHQIVHDVPTSVLKKMLLEAVKTIRDYALPTGDRASEAALHEEINLMLNELHARRSREGSAIAA